jgi:hypothetical protein
LERDAAAALYAIYDEIQKMLVAMITHSENWIIEPLEKSQ